MLAATTKNMPHRIGQYFEQVASKYDDKEFRENFRLSREAFHFVLQTILQVFEGEEPIKIEKALLSVIWLLATPDSYRSLGSRLNLGKSSLSRDFVKIVNGLNQIASNFIKWPNAEEMERSKTHFEDRYGEQFRNTIGAIDGTYVPVKVPSAHHRVYTNRKQFTSMTLQVVANENLAFIDCFTGFPSSVNDLRVFRNSVLYATVQQRPEEFFPHGEVILGDKAYQNLPWLVTPHIDRGYLNEEHLNFNRQHSKARSNVERSFAHFFGRFRRFQDLNMNRLDWVAGTIIAGCVLHNVCVLCNDNLQAYIEEGIPVAIRNAANNMEEND